MILISILVSLQMFFMTAGYLSVEFHKVTNYPIIRLFLTNSHV